MKNDTPSNETEITESEPKKGRRNSGSGIAMGVAIGVAIGAATDNIGLWIALGTAFGAAFDSGNHFLKKD